MRAFGVFSWLIFLIVVVIIIHGRHFWWSSFGGHSPNYCRPPLGALDDDHGRSSPKRVNHGHQSVETGVK